MVTLSNSSSDVLGPVRLDSGTGTLGPVEPAGSGPVDATSPQPATTKTVKAINIAYFIGDCSYKARVEMNIRELYLYRLSDGKRALVFREIGPTGRFP